MILEKQIYVTEDNKEFSSLAEAVKHETDLNLLCADEVFIVIRAFGNEYDRTIKKGRIIKKIDSRTCLAYSDGYGEYICSIKDLHTSLEEAKKDLVDSCVKSISYYDKELGKFTDKINYINNKITKLKQKIEENS